MTFFAAICFVGQAPSLPLWTSRGLEAERLQTQIQKCHTSQRCWQHILCRNTSTFFVAQFDVNFISAEPTCSTCFVYLIQYPHAFFPSVSVRNKLQRQSSSFKEKRDFTHFRYISSSPHNSFCIDGSTGLPRDWLMKICWCFCVWQKNCVFIIVFDERSLSESEPIGHRSSFHTACAMNQDCWYHNNWTCDRVTTWALWHIQRLV